MTTSHLNPSHTPGLWIVNYDGLNIDAKQDDGVEQIASVNRSNDEREANARLIASAPELLEALKGLFEHCAMVHKHWGAGSNASEAQAAQDFARAAIAKAEGKVSRG
jgi:hypothetical protein